MPLLRKLNDRNQITIPARILRDIGIGRGDFIEIDSKGHLILLRPKVVEDRFSESEWRLLEALVKRQIKKRQYKDYKHPEGARSHFEKLI